MQTSMKMVLSHWGYDLGVNRGVGKGRGEERGHLRLNPGLYWENKMNW